MSASFRKSLATQTRVIHALVLREVKTRFGRLQLGYLWAFLEPALYVGIFALLLQLGGRTAPSGMPITLFMVTGVVPFLVFRDAMQRAMSAILSNQPLLTFPQVTPLDLVVARALLEAVSRYLVMIVFVAILAFVEPGVKIERPLELIWWMVVIGIIGFGLGAAFGSVSIMFPSIERLVPTLLSRPLFFISGLFFTVEMIPENLRELALTNPFLHIIEHIRSSFFVEFESQYATVAYPVFFLLITLFLGLVLQRGLRRQILNACQQ